MKVTIIKHWINNNFPQMRKSGKRFMMLAVFFASFFGFSQKSQKKELTAADYHLWSSSRQLKLSENGKWLSYLLYYGNGRDTLFVKSSKGTKTYSFPGASKGEFCGDRWFFYRTPNEELKITDLTTSKQETIQGVVQYNLRAKTNDLIILKKGTDGKKQLELRNPASNPSILLSDIDFYSYNPKIDAVAYTAKSGNSTTIALFHLRDKIITVVERTAETCKYTNIIWQENGSSIAFLKQPLDAAEKIIRTSVGHYAITEGKLAVFNPALQNDFPADMEIISSPISNLSISKDGKRIFFKVKKTTNTTDTSQVQTWNAQDKALYPAKVLIDGWNSMPKAAVWRPEEHRFNYITDNEFPKMMLSGDQKQAFLFNPLQYEPQADRDAPLDIYIMDLATGKRKLVLQNQPAGGTSISICGEYLAYFKDRNWWVYDYRDGLHKNLTKDLGVFFSDRESDWPEESAPYGNPGWTAEDKTLFIYDKYDIWKIPLDASPAYRLTNGRENRTTHRIVVQSEDQSPHKINYDGLYKGLFKPSDRLLIKTEALEHTGYCFWDRKNGVQSLLDKKMQTSQFMATEKNDCYAYVEEKFNTPPRILFKENRSSKEKVLFQSNPQHFKYNWGNSKLITYANSKGSVLNGVLYYPADYHADTKYPMVVYVYEKLSKELYKYVNPSQNNPTGFNIANFTSKGYFVLLPDIVYEIGNPGSSATDCVVSAAKKIIGTESIDSTRIGLIGHSWGGYETDFIITQTDMFAAAVAGAAITNYVSSYLWIIPDMDEPNFYHAEYGQLRIGKSLYEDYAAYLRNSPIYHADKVNTPLLSWAGEQDSQVSYYQSVEFYMALRRLGKINTMLLYPKENHTLSDPIHKQHLTQSIEQWFDHYLKGDKKPDSF
jgi:dipeptidyl aminopeptidase/acylaminoacyl peptidase